MSTPLVLSEDDALELLGYLVTSARTQVDEAAEYGTLRLLTAATRLAAMVAPRASDATRALAETSLREVPPMPLRTSDPTAYVEQVDELARAVAAHLVAHFDLPAAELDP